jgi:hypothetical protein
MCWAHASTRAACAPHTAGPAVRHYVDHPADRRRGAQAPALADGPLRLDNHLTDKVGALGDRRDQACAALDLLRNETGLQLSVAVVRSFDGTPAKRWAEDVAT